MEAKNCAGKEHFMRMNFLRQLSLLTTEKAEDNSNYEILSKFYTQVMLSIAKKTLLKIDVQVKRTICKKCFSILLPAKTCRVRFRSKPKKHVNVTCNTCGKRKIFNTVDGYRVWTEDLAAITNIINF